MRPYLEKILHRKWAGGVFQGISPEFKPQYRKRKKKTPRTLGVFEGSQAA
jgi:hypothetical protein